MQVIVMLFDVFHNISNNLTEFFVTFWGHRSNSMGKQSKDLALSRNKQ